MRIIGKTIDATGNFILSKNRTFIYLEGANNLTIANFVIYGVRGVRSKLLATWKAFAFIWLGVER